MEEVAAVVYFNILPQYLPDSSHKTSGLYVISFDLGLFNCKSDILPLSLHVQQTLSMLHLTLELLNA